MPLTKIGSLGKLNKNFEGRDMHWLSAGYRALKPDEIKALIKNNNTAEDWAKIKVSQKFDTSLINNCAFWGLVCIGSLEKKFLAHDGLNLPCGLSNSLIISSDIGENASIRNVHYLSHYRVGKNSILFNIDEMTSVADATFGEGCLDVTTHDKPRNWLEISNENGGRAILPFAGMIPADAFLWSRFRDEAVLQKKLIKFTDNLADDDRDPFGFIGENSVIKNSRLIKNCRIGANSYIGGINKLSNLTIQSSEGEPTQIDEGCDLEDGIIGYGNKIYSGAKCSRFLTGRNVKIALGARVINTLIGANSTISCCEVLNNLIFPFHEQHHNNSFLIAATILGQSNIAAGATIGSNHNSRAADGEIFAGRGFWPGLESSYKHNSVFSSFTLIAKGAYENELNIKLPFSLVSKNPSSGKVQLFPAFWFRYNMYALARNSWKFKNRDKRIIKDQNIEIDFLAPDSALEMLEGISLLENAILQQSGKTVKTDLDFFDKKNELTGIYLEDISPKEKTIIIKPVQAIWLYKKMLAYFAAREILSFAQTNDFNANTFLKGTTTLATNWMNFGGQLITENDYLGLITEIKSEQLSSWDAIHARYKNLWENYGTQKRDVAIDCWAKSIHKKTEDISMTDIRALLILSKSTSAQIVEWTKESRLKDYSNPFRKMSYRNKEEMDAVLGKYDENAFIMEMETGHSKYIAQIDEAVSQLR